MCSNNIMIPSFHRDLINTFIALVKECADEVKSAADEIKTDVNRAMKESANKSVTLMKKSKGLINKLLLVTVHHKKAVKSAHRTQK